MKRLLTSLAMGAALALVSATASAETFSVKTSTIGDLLDNAEASAIFEEHLPDVYNHPQLDMGLGMTLVQAQSFEPALITDEKLAAMEADLQKLSSGE